MNSNFKNILVLVLTLVLVLGLSAVVGNQELREKKFNNIETLNEKNVQLVPSADPYKAMSFQKSAEEPRLESYDTLMLQPTYNEAVSWAGDRKIMFDEACHAYPENSTFKTGSTVLIDNYRAPHEFRYLDSKITLVSGGFAFVTFARPGNFVISCDDGLNVAKVSIIE